MSRQNAEKKVTSQLRQREIMLRQGFLCWMSKPGGTCRDRKCSCSYTRIKYKEKSQSRHKISCRETDYCNLENPVETLYEEVMSRQSDEVATLEDKVLIEQPSHDK